VPKNFPEENSGSELHFSDGLGPMQRWERDRVDPSTVSVIVQRVSDGERLKLICKSRGWPYGKVAEWIASSPKVASAYEQALRLGADDLALETVAISDEQALAYSNRGDPFDPDVGRDMLRVKSRQWVASRLFRDRYGDKVEVKGEVRHTHSLIAILGGLGTETAPALPEKDVTPAVTVAEEDPI